ncbi:MAG TPA: FGGY family carbohydrate kinase [Kofleriaceae bacterium]|nr:FGGY family carbohydrate kinase [Kofleriaceae bacterium]
MRFVGIDLGTQSLKAVVCDERFEVLGSHAIATTTHYPHAGHAEQDPHAWEAALAPAISGALAAAKCSAADVTAIGVSGQLDGCVACAADGTAMQAALIWQDKRADARLAIVTPARLFEITGQVADAGHMAPKIRWLKAKGEALTWAPSRYHQPVTFLVERLTGAAVIDPSHASTTMLYDLLAGTWSRELLDAFGIDERELPTIAPATSIAGALTKQGAALTGLREGTPVAVGTGDDFATPLGAGIVDAGKLIVALGTAEVVGTIASIPVFDRPSARAETDPWRALDDAMVETHAYPSGGFFIENPGWMSGGVVRWTTQLLGLGSDAELDALAASAPPGAGGVTFVPALTGAMTPVWRSGARGTLHGLGAEHDRSHVARAVLEGLAFACRDVAARLTALGLPLREAIVLGGGGRSRVWTQIRADALGIPHLVAARADTCPVGAAMIAAVAAGVVPDLRAAAACVPTPQVAALPQRDLDAAYARYHTLVAVLAEHEWPR